MSSSTQGSGLALGSACGRGGGCFSLTCQAEREVRGTPPRLCGDVQAGSQLSCTTVTSAQVPASGCPSCIFLAPNGGCIECPCTVLPAKAVHLTTTLALISPAANRQMKAGRPAHARTHMGRTWNQSNTTRCECCCACVHACTLVYVWGFGGWWFWSCCVCGCFCVGQQMPGPTQGSWTNTIRAAFCLMVSEVPAEGSALQGWLHKQLEAHIRPLFFQRNHCPHTGDCSLYPADSLVSKPVKASPLSVCELAFEPASASAAIPAQSPPATCSDATKLARQKAETAALGSHVRSRNTDLRRLRTKGCRFLDDLAVNRADRGALDLNMHLSAGAIYERGTRQLTAARRGTTHSRFCVLQL